MRVLDSTLHGGGIRAVKRQRHSRAHIFCRARIVNRRVIIAGGADFDLPRHLISHLGPMREIRTVGRACTACDAAGRDPISCGQARGFPMAHGKGAVVGDGQHFGAKFCHGIGQRRMHLRMVLRHVRRLPAICHHIVQLARHIQPKPLVARTELRPLVRQNNPVGPSHLLAHEQGLQTAPVQRLFTFQINACQIRKGRQQINRGRDFLNHHARPNPPCPAHQTGHAHAALIC